MCHLEVREERRGWELSVQRQEESTYGVSIHCTDMHGICIHQNWTCIQTVCCMCVHTAYGIWHVCMYSVLRTYICMHMKAEIESVPPTDGYSNSRHTRQDRMALQLHAPHELYNPHHFVRGIVYGVIAYPHAG